MQRRSNITTDQIVLRTDESLSMPAFTLALWVLCLGVGLVGFAVRTDPPRAAAHAPEPLVIQERLEVEFKKEEPSPTSQQQISASVRDRLIAPPAPESLPKVSIAESVTVVKFEPEAGFLSAVQQPPGRAASTQVAPATPTRGTPSTDSLRAGSPSLAPQPLVFGEGEGKQPPPEYPRQALRQRQHGTVLVRLDVDEAGHVVDARAAIPCPWPLLNQAAVRAVRERWLFREGPVRVYEVPIRFELSQ